MVTEVKSIIYKYPIELNPQFEVEMPLGATVIHAESQGVTTPFMWAIIDPDAPIHKRKFCLRGTGHPFTGEEGRHIASFQMMGGQLVWHLFNHIDEEEPRG